MAYKVFIDGEAGTTGLEIKKRLQKQEDIELLAIENELRKDIDTRLAYYDKADIVFLCLPDSESKEIASKASDHTKIIDASTAFRTNEHWVYGLPELNDTQRSSIMKSNRVADPGCHATGFILLIRPLIDEGIIEKDALLTAHSLTGYSGGGKSMIQNYENDRTDNNYLDAPGLYGLNQEHKHLPEMVKHSGIELKPVFDPIVDDYYRGMLVSIPLHASLLNREAGQEDIIDIYNDRYKGDRLISVADANQVSQNGFVYSNSHSGRDDIELIISGNRDRIVLSARYDNLGKGASGAAIQNMNIMLGRPEYSGLII